MLSSSQSSLSYTWLSNNTRIIKIYLTTVNYRGRLCWYTRIGIWGRIVIGCKISSSCISSRFRIIK